MKKMILASGIVATILLSGCGASNGIGLGKQEVKSYFEKGTIVRSEKVLVDKSVMATVTGAGVGAIGGAVIGAKKDNTLQGIGIGGLVGAGVGFVGGYLMGNNEAEAFEVDIKNAKTGELHEAYLENDLKIGTKVEFVVRENLVTNINLSKK